MGSITETELKDEIIKMQQELPTKADTIEQKVLTKFNISLDEYLLLINGDTTVQSKMMKLNDFITKATSMIEPEFDQSELFD